MPKGWALPGNTRFGKKGRRKKLKPSNLNPKDKLTAKEMHEKLLELAHSGEIDEDHRTVITLETFKATGSSSIGED
ncbi:25110_t:CDS:2 [Gigaspora margarita]|uniref:25110_t:CDS:1 n=1 Tax=Gigaspora margarita TaxID=4874 RepID=A0ABN7V719_GIGMA|nr:25110_t:CDS:2 [Gigaspora margarita]